MNKIFPLTIIIVALFLINSASAEKTQTESTANVLEQAVALYKTGQKQQAEDKLSQFIQSANYSNVSERSLIYKSYLTLADIYRRRSAYLEEVKLFQQLFKHLKVWKLDKSVDAVMIKRQLGEAQIQSGQENLGIATLQEGIQLAEKIFKPKDIRLANLRLILAQTHINRLEIELAENLLQQAIFAVENLDDRTSLILKSRIIQARGELFFRQAKTKQASLIYAKALQQRQQLFGHNHLETAQSLISYASSLKGLHRFPEAEELYRQGYRIYDQKMGADHVFMATILNNLGQLYYLQGRFAEAEEVLFRALDIKQQHFPEQHISLAETYNHLGYVYFYLDDFKQAEQFLDKAIKIWSLPNSSRPRYKANAQAWKTIIAYHLGRDFQLVADKMHQVISTLESIYGKNSVSTSDAFHHLGMLYHREKQFAKAETAYLNGLNAAEQFGLGDRLTEILLHAKLAELYIELDREQSAWNETQKSLNGLELRIKRFSGLRAHSLATELKSLRTAVISNISVLYRMIQDNQGKSLGLSKEQLLEQTFKAAQISRAGSVARALAQMEQRFAEGNNELAELIRNRQDLLEQWQEIDSVLTATMSSAENIKDRQAETELYQKAQSLKLQIEKADQKLKEKYPDYSNLTQSNPLSIKQVQNLLKQDEGLLIYLFGKEKSYLWTITPDQADIFQLSITENELSDTVFDLRHFLEPIPNQKDSQVPTFPVNLSHQLFNKLLQPAMPLLTDSRHLLLVADQALQSLPISLLVVTDPKQPIKTPAEHIGVDWLIKHKSIAVIPAVSSLAILRNENIPDSAQKPFLGIGDPALKKFRSSEKKNSNTAPENPLLAQKNNQVMEDSQRGVSRGVSRGMNRGVNRGMNRGMNRGLNRGMNRGVNRGMNRGVNRGLNRGMNRGLNRGMNRGMNRGVSRNAMTDITANLGAYVDLEDIALMIELPDTADELRTISNILSGQKNDLYLREQATRSQILNLNSEDYKVVQFATHGLMAGEFQGLFEPAIVLSPEIQEPFYDNGLLTASDISQLRLNADFVVLSACNTAAPDGTPGAEGLSGLGRAFFYAGSQNLMLTHWEVMSDAAVKMTTQIFDYLNKNQNKDIALAHQQSTLQLIQSKEKPYYAHPMFWAPFMIVGGN